MGDSGLEHFQDAVPVARISVLPGVEAAVPEFNPKGCYVENLDLRRPVTGPFAMPRLISQRRLVCRAAGARGFWGRLT